MNIRKLFALGALFLVMCTLSRATDQPKTTSLNGKVFLSATKQPVANATIILLDEKKSDKRDNSVETQTDAEGNYSFTQVAAGTYTVSIRAWYPTQEAAPCQLLMAKTAEKNSTMMVARDKNEFVQQLFIKGFSIKAGKEMTKDFDFTCKSMFGG
jgi:predicted phage tail protein